jgi:hypothetical protein
MFYTDLQFGIVESNEVCTQINGPVFLTSTLHILIAFLLLLARRWFSFLLNIPILYLLAQNYFTKSYPHKYHPIHPATALHEDVVCSRRILVFCIILFLWGICVFALLFRVHFLKLFCFLFFFFAAFASTLHLAVMINQLFLRGR